LCLMMCFAIFADSARGNRIGVLARRGRNFAGGVRKKRARKPRRDQPRRRRVHGAGHGLRGKVWLVAATVERGGHDKDCQSRRIAIQSHAFSIKRVNLMAITNSRRPPAAIRRTFRIRTGWARTAGLRLAVVCALLAGALNTRGAEDSNAVFARRAKAEYVACKARFKLYPEDAEAAWQFGRACFDWADFSANDEQREAIAQEGIAACRQTVRLNGKLAAGHYYLGLNLGQSARTKMLGALKLVDEMEREFSAARALDSKFSHAGPDRSLGLLYSQAPGWPASIGDKEKARTHLERAVELAPGYPANHLCLLEAYVKWGDKKNLPAEFRQTRALLPKAREEFSGEQWERDWEDWNARWKRIREQVEGLE
jgi:tetratricopeptide (TPR) repeat protein